MTEFRKDSKDKETKPMFHLYDPFFHLEQVQVLTFGAKKYGLYNWKNAKLEELHHYEDALYRHLNAYQRGEYFDKETHITHFSHAAINLMFLYWFQQRGLILH